MALACFDFDAGQPRHFPAGSYYDQVQTAVGRVELDTMRLLRRCWLVFKRKKLNEWDSDDEDFARWVVTTPINDDVLNRMILWQWQAA